MKQDNSDKPSDENEHETQQKTVTTSNEDDTNGDKQNTNNIYCFSKRDSNDGNGSDRRER